MVIGSSVTPRKEDSTEGVYLSRDSTLFEQRVAGVDYRIPLIE